jgi:hypothetical protein
MELASSPELAQVRCLDLTGEDIGIDGVHRNHLSAEFIRLLLASPRVSSLTSLILRNTRLDDEAMLALALAQSLLPAFPA